MTVAAPCPNDPAVRPLVVGNWKMLCPDDPETALAAIERASARCDSVDVALCPPFTLLADVRRNAPAIRLGAQDCHVEPGGAFTGGVSAELLRRAGVDYVILGHSERRRAGDADTDVRAKARCAAAAGLTPLICIGETWDERRAGYTGSRLTEQLARCAPPGAGRWIVAYEPVWAIGAGVTPSIEEIAAAADTIRAAAAGCGGGAGVVTVLYGGSVTARNARQLMSTPGVDGLLVGKASLDPDEFAAIIREVERPMISCGAGGAGVA